MDNMTLSFKSAEQLWQFKQAIKAHEVEVNFRECTITLAYKEEEYALAVEKFAAEPAFGNNTNEG